MKYVNPVSPQNMYAPRENPQYDWGPSLTDQSFKDECDTQKILEKYSDLGLPAPSAAVKAVYGDFTDLRNLQDHLNNARAMLQQAEEGFMQLDARTRRRFDNDVAKMVQWLGDEANREEAISLGLIEKKEEIIPPPPVGSSPEPSSPSKS